jgi:hypothetical protein
LKQEIKCDKIIDFIRILYTVTSEDGLTLDKVIHILGKEIVEKDFLKEKIENL